MRVLLLGICLAVMPPVHAGLEVFDFGGKVDEQRYKDLIGELRCLVCQNQSLADSDAELAHDLRKEVYELMAQGKSNDEIIEFLVDRYGDFVLYKPPVKPSTWALWYGPFALLLVGVLVLARTVRQRHRQADPELSEEERRRLKKILGEDGEGSGSA
ncbi:MAG TPA: cytochrome c-type biogenesis protein CcmH [Gammaproteobacteria bacterium]|nr:cytochrome c-type biogenesis protein CcmH [Gammaproteobacteria bacterium]